MDECVQMYEKGPLHAGLPTLSSMSTPGFLGTAVFRLKKEHRDILDAYAPCFYDETTHELRRVGDSHPCYLVMFDPPLHEKANIMPWVDGVAESLKVTHNSYYAFWRKQRGIVCVLVKTADLSRTAAALSSSPGSLTGNV